MECFTEDFDLHVKQGKMTEERKVELLAKVQKLVDGETTGFAGVERDIRVIKDSETGDMVIDMIAHWMKIDEDDPEAMSMSYASSKSVIKDATPAQLERAVDLMHRIIQSSLIGMDMPGGDVERNAIQSALDAQGREQIFNFMKPE